jgi:hypothetical protein
MLVFPIVTRKPWGFAILLLNIFLPSSGTFMAAGNAEDKKLMVWGILQLLTLFIGVGVIWSWLTGIMIFMRSEPALDASESPVKAAPTNTAAANQTATKPARKSTKKTGKATA